MVGRQVVRFGVQIESGVVRMFPAVCVLFILFQYSRALSNYVLIKDGGSSTKYKDIFKSAKYLNRLMQSKNYAANREKFPVPVTLEIGLYVTSDLKESFYKEFEVKDLAGGRIFESTMLSNYIRGTNEIFGDKSIGDLKIKVVFAPIHTVPEVLWRKWTDLSAFCDYQANDTNVDISILVLKKDGEAAGQMNTKSLGQTYRDGFCMERWRCGLIQETPLLYSASKRLISHEIGHALGLIDQGRRLERKIQLSQTAKDMVDKRVPPYDDLSCLGDQIGLMAATGDQWLKCSVNALHKILSSERGQCLRNRPKASTLPDGTFIGMVRYIAREQMCNIYLRNTENLSEIKLVYNVTAPQPICKFGRGECTGIRFLGGGRQRLVVMDDQNWPIGTRCSPFTFDHFCYDGKCLPHNVIQERTTKIIDG